MLKDSIEPPLDTARYRGTSAGVADCNPNGQFTSHISNGTEDLTAHLTFSVHKPSVGARGGEKQSEVWLKVSNTGDSLVSGYDLRDEVECSVKTRTVAEQSFGIHGSQHTGEESSPRVTAKKVIKMGVGLNSKAQLSNPFLQVLDGAIQELKRTSPSYSSARSTGRRGFRHIGAVASTEPTMLKPSKLTGFGTQEASARQTNQSPRQKIHFSENSIHQARAGSARTLSNDAKVPNSSRKENLITEPKSRPTTRNNSIDLGLREVPLLASSEALSRKAGKRMRGYSNPLVKINSEINQRRISLMTSKLDAKLDPHTKPGSNHNFSKADDKFMNHSDSETLVPQLIEENHTLKVKLAAEQKANMSMRVALESLKAKLKDAQLKDKFVRQPKSKPDVDQHRGENSRGREMENSRDEYQGNQTLGTELLDGSMMQRSFLKRPSRPTQMTVFLKQAIGSSTQVSEARPHDISTQNKLQAPLMFSTGVLDQYCKKVTKKLATDRISGSFAQLVATKLGHKKTQTDNRSHFGSVQDAPNYTTGLAKLSLQTPFEGRKSRGSSTQR